ncbi:MAG: 50S ribosomal protein L24 [Verrucomicrobia bacterium]|nr:50S ribosomal protein L24 [Verrucomicrobiota bacterium]
MKLHVKKNDLVVVIRGNNRGVRGTILSANPQKARVVVRAQRRDEDEGNERIGVIRKAVRKSQDHPRGGFIDMDRSYHVSAVMLAKTYDERRAKRAAKEAKT